VRQVADALHAARLAPATPIHIQPPSQLELLMLTAYAIVGALLTAYLTFSATAEFARIRPVMAAMAKADVPQSWLPTLATLKAAGALGLLVGIVVPLTGLSTGIQTAATIIGAAAAVGVILFFVGAVITHLRAHEPLTAFAPASVFLLLAVTTLGLGLAAA
jgi:DoxX-like family